MSTSADNIPESEQSLPTVVIVGRPNVGKSSLLNMLARRRIAIVHPTSGVTRDRVSALVEHHDRAFELWDTGGIGPADVEALDAEVQVQIEVALRRADLILFVVDARDGYNAIDQGIAERIRQINRPTLLVANKVDDAKVEAEVPDLMRLGFDAAIPVAAMHGTGRTDLLERILKALPRTVRSPARKDLTLAIVGRQNVGKSTLVNRLAHEERVIVSEVAGTTRDAIDVRFKWNGQDFLLIDTAGLKRRSKQQGSLEFYSAHRAERSIRRADVVIFMIDATRDISRTDKKVAAYIEQEFKPCVIVVNKWDLAGGLVTGEYMKYLEANLRVLDYAPVVFASAAEGLNLDGILDMAVKLKRQSQLRVGTGELNRAVQEATSRHSPRARAGKLPKLLYATQVGVDPPTIVLFVSHVEKVTDTYRRYLANFLREEFGFGEVPLQIYFRDRRSEQKNAERGRSR